MQAGSESKKTDKYLVYRESYLVKKNLGVRIHIRIAYFVKRIEGKLQVANYKFQKRSIHEGALLAALTGSLENRVTGQLVYIASYNLLPNQLTS